MPIRSFFKGLKNMWVGTYDNYSDIIIPAKLGLPGTFNINNAESVSTVYICVKTLADTLSKLPLNVYQESEEGRLVDKYDYRYPLIHYNPNNYTSSQTFFAALEYYRNIKGNAFARIYRDKLGKVDSLEIISPSRMTGYGIENGELYYMMLEGEEQSATEVKINSSEILHFRTLTKDGVWGINPIEALRLNISSTVSGLTTLDSFYRNNATSPKAIKSTISGQNQKAMIEALNEFKEKYSGPVNAGHLIPLPPNTEIVDMNLNFLDAIFIDTIKFNAGQIASLYGVPPHLVGIFESSKFNNVEQMMLDFKATTLTAIARMYRQEMEHKLLTTEERLNGKSIEFNLMALVEADSTTRINNQLSLMKSGVITPNDVATKEGYKAFEGGEKHYMLGNYVAVEDKKEEPTLELNSLERGGPGSGHHGHEGKKGGGSTSSGGSSGKGSFSEGGDPIKDMGIGFDEAKDSANYKEGIPIEDVDWDKKGTDANGQEYALGPGEELSSNDVIKQMKIEKESGYSDIEKSLKDAKKTMDGENPYKLKGVYVITRTVDKNDISKGHTPASTMSVSLRKTSTFIEQGGKAKYHTYQQKFFNKKEVNEILEG